MSDWENESIRKVYAGTNCIMAITDDGRVLQKVTDEKYGASRRFAHSSTAIRAIPEKNSVR